MSIQECNLVILQAILFVSHKHRNKLPSTQVHNGLQWGNNKKANQADLGTFTHILAYSGMFRNYSGILECCVTPAYSEPWYIQNQKPRYIQHPVKYVQWRVLQNC